MKKLLTFEELSSLAVKMADKINKDDVIALVGDLGTGKTTFVKNLAKHLGVKGNIKSPTFTYVIEYTDVRPPIYHFDVYRISDPEEIYEIGFEDYLHNGGIVIIEWANLIEDELPEEYLKIEIEYYDDVNRHVNIEFVGNTDREKEILEYVDFRN